jgi:hypothetical protein
MKKLAAIALVFVALPLPVWGHALDAYLQAAIFSVHKDRIDLSMRLVPGIAILPQIMKNVDTDGDGAISPAEARAYAMRLSQELIIEIDGHRMSPHLVSAMASAPILFRDGLGDIRADFQIDVQPRPGDRRLRFVNRHQSRISVYLVNAEVPRDTEIKLVAQQRSADQSTYELAYAQSATASQQPVNVSGFGNMFRLGMRHIAEGTDHLLFLLTLLLPAPLYARGARWAGSARWTTSLVAILKVVTAFTLGHSLTLALGASGLVIVPDRPIEILIAVSILISALHAARPIFPGKEAAIAAFFGLIHGLAFASALNTLGLGVWDKVWDVAGFNLGIEAMQFAVIAMVMPSLLLLSRTRGYTVLRVGGASFAGIAALGWIAQRIFGVDWKVDAAVNALATHALWLAPALFSVSVLFWVFARYRQPEQAC